MTDVLKDQFIPAQLIMVNHDTLAQYWQASPPFLYFKSVVLTCSQDFGHVSFYRRVDIDQYLRNIDAAPAARLP